MGRREICCFHVPEGYEKDNFYSALQKKKKKKLLNISVEMYLSAKERNTTHSISYKVMCAKGTSCITTGNFSLICLI